MCPQALTAPLKAFCDAASDFSCFVFSIKTARGSSDNISVLIKRALTKMKKVDGTSSLASQGVGEAFRHGKYKRASNKQEIKLSPQPSCTAGVKTPRSIFLYYTTINRERGQELLSSAPWRLLISFRIIVLAHKLRSLTVLLAIKEPYAA